MDTDRDTYTYAYTHVDINIHTHMHTRTYEYIPSNRELRLAWNDDVNSSVVIHLESTWLAHSCGANLLVKIPRQTHRGIYRNNAKKEHVQQTARQSLYRVHTDKMFCTHSVLLHLGPKGERE